MLACTQPQKVPAEDLPPSETASTKAATDTASSCDGTSSKALSISSDANMPAASAVDESGVETSAATADEGKAEAASGSTLEGCAEAGTPTAAAAEDPAGESADAAENEPEDHVLAGTRMYGSEDSVFADTQFYGGKKDEGLSAKVVALAHWALADLPSKDDKAEGERSPALRCPQRSPQKVPAEGMPLSETVSTTAATDNALSCDVSSSKALSTSSDANMPAASAVDESGVETSAATADEGKAEAVSGSTLEGGAGASAPMTAAVDPAGKSPDAAEHEPEDHMLACTQMYGSEDSVFADTQFYGQDEHEGLSAKAEALAQLVTAAETSEKVGEQEDTFEVKRSPALRCPQRSPQKVPAVDTLVPPPPTTTTPTPPQPPPTTLSTTAAGTSTTPTTEGSSEGVRGTTLEGFAVAGVPTSVAEDPAGKSADAAEHESDNHMLACTQLYGSEDSVFADTQFYGGDKDEGPSTKAVVPARLVPADAPSLEDNPECNSSPALCRPQCSFQRVPAVEMPPSAILSTTDARDKALTCDGAWSIAPSSSADTNMPAASAVDEAAVDQATLATSSDANMPAASAVDEAAVESTEALTTDGRSEGCAVAGAPTPTGVDPAGTSADAAENEPEDHMLACTQMYGGEDSVFADTQFYGDGGDERPSTKVVALAHVATATKPAEKAGEQDSNSPFKKDTVEVKRSPALR
eukprot:TRINITY_DN2576_c0_g1_i12.p1 TRINITY_DN2576_c0_g1~~TRINITY_DN2576_c0_g1_i12.p1  ORF type:complete len:697 (-),score=166.23 TRINITY_DN2576_c0_g1_i12:1070-3160(-)